VTYAVLTEPMTVDERARVDEWLHQDPEAAANRAAEEARAEAQRRKAERWAIVRARQQAVMA
jgi:hypothetical protein